MALLVVLSWTPYLLAEQLGLSGIMASLFCAVMIAHYTARNLSSDTQVAAGALFRTLAFFAGSFSCLLPPAARQRRIGEPTSAVHCTSACNLQSTHARLPQRRASSHTSAWPRCSRSARRSTGASSAGPSCALLRLLLRQCLKSQLTISVHVQVDTCAQLFCMLGRALNVFLLSALLNLCRRRAAARITFAMQVVMWFTGLRGAVAVGLCMQLEGRLPRETYDTLVNATCGIVVFSIVVFGTGTWPLLKARSRSNANTHTHTRLICIYEETRNARRMAQRCTLL